MNKRILITGASSGLGLAMAAALAQAGHQVYGSSRQGGAAHSANGVTMLALDINDQASVVQAVDAMYAQAGGIDVLINNAGYGLAGALEDCSIDELRAQLETNFFGQLRLIQQVLPIMRRQGGGRIINVGSLAGAIGMPYQAAYSASKAALHSITEALRLELRGSGIDCTVLAPGDFCTGFTSARVQAQAAAQSPHSEVMASVIGQYQKDELNGPSPDVLAKRCVKLVQQETLKPLYSVGRVDQRFALLLKRWLPAAWFERLMCGIYPL